MHFLRYHWLKLTDSFSEISLTCSSALITDYETVSDHSLFSDNTSIPFKRANASVARLSLLDDSYWYRSCVPNSIVSGWCRGKEEEGRENCGVATREIVSPSAPRRFPFPASENFLEMQRSRSLYMCVYTYIFAESLYIASPLIRARNIATGPGAPTSS